MGHIGLRHVYGACLIALTVAVICYLAFPRYTYQPIGVGGVVLKHDRWTGNVWAGQINRGFWIQLPYDRP